MSPTQQAAQRGRQPSPVGRVLRPYQQAAVKAIVEGLAGGGRGQLHAACGSGKTLIAVEAGRQLLPGPQSLVLVFAPSLALVAQTIREWRQTGQVDAVLAVCSDDTVVDAPTHLADVPAHTTTSVPAIASWLHASTGRRLVVSTYLSATLLADALRETGTVADLAVHDEAHHLTGRAEFVTRRILDPTVLPATRRLFMTATPRVDDVRVVTSGALSMSDTDTYGPVLYSYPWARAISEGYLDDYRVVVAGVTQREMYDLLRDEQHDHIDGPGGPDLRLLAAQAVLARTARQYGLRRIIAFCPRLDAAAEFCRTLPATLSRLDARDRPDGPVHAVRITGEHSHAERDQILETLRHPPGQWTVVTNVRCLSEGVDVPTADAVLFAHPKRSQVDIVQAVGRALRRGGQQQATATVIVPIVIPDSSGSVGDLDAGQFQVLWQVLRALRAHDESLGIELDINRIYEGLGTDPVLPDKISIVLPEGTSDRLLRQLRALTVRQTTSSWWVGYGHARAWHTEHGHLQVPSNHTTPDGFGLGQWVINARQHRRKGWLRPDRIAALDKIDMVWDTTALPWERFLDELRAFREQHGHLLVPQTYTTRDGYRLGSKLNSTRTRHRTVPEAVRGALNDLGMVWDSRDLRWQELFTACQQYVAEHGHLDVKKGYVTAEGYPLGVRLAAARRKAQKGTLDPAERASLEELGAHLDSPSVAWSRFLAACDRYVADHGSLASVSRFYTDADGYRLGAAINYYRALAAGTKPGGLPDERRAALDARGMIWRRTPNDTITTDQAEQLRHLTGPPLGAAILDLVDHQGVTQASIAEALGVHRSHLNTKIKTFRETGTWTTRRRR